jgi:hypothetical protein
MSKILNRLQEKAFITIASVPAIRSKFYFTGGTALSELYLGHRESVDLDFFSESPFGKIVPESVISAVVSAGMKVREVRKIHDRHVFEIFDDANPPCHVDICHYDFPRLYPHQWNLHGVRTDSIRDIWVNKWATILDRNEPERRYRHSFHGSILRFFPKKGFARYDMFGFIEKIQCRLWSGIACFALSIQIVFYEGLGIS